MSADNPTGSPPKSSGIKPPGRKSAAASAPDLAKALRTVYDKTLREDVPSDFMDLLGKLR